MPSTTEAERRSIDRLVDRLDAAVALGAPGAICNAIKQALVAEISSERLELPEAILRPSPAGYARRLLHRDPRLRYTVVVMVWGQGQGTPIHDHDDKWCVECVFRGRIRVESYDLVGTEADGRVRLERSTELTAGFAEAGALIPPFDYHVIEHQGAEPAVTIHVYGGEIEGCQVFRPLGEGLYTRERKPLRYSDS